MMDAAKGETVRDSEGASSDRPAKLRMSSIYNTTQAQGHSLVTERNRERCITTNPSATATPYPFSYPFTHSVREH